MKKDARRLVVANSRSGLAYVGILMLVLGAVCRETVIEAKGFSESKMLSLPEGSSQADAMRVLGPPLDRWNHWNSAGQWDGAYWSYRKTTSFGATHHAVLIFSPDERLRGRELEWYED
jgi:hypothetical protein